MKRCGIYVLTHSASGLRYVGQSVDIDRRMSEHAKGHVSSKGHLRSAIWKHGWDAFAVSVVELCDRASLNAAEAAWIAKLGSMHPNGFNLTSGGMQFAKAPISDATREKMRKPKTAAHRAAIRDAALRNTANLTRFAELSRHQTPEGRAKIAASKRGLRLSAETKAKIAAARRSDLANLARLAKHARSRTPAERAKMSASAKARWARARVLKGTQSPP